MPRYVRVNYLLSSDAEAEEHLKSYGYDFVPKFSTSSDNTVNVAKNCAQWDPVVPGLFALAPGTSMHGDELVESGALVLQDRSSCLTALALSPPPDAKCVDTCSAPGNKTMHVASLMGPNATGSVSAFERSHQRYLTLERRIGVQGGEGFVKPIERDFMSVDVNSEFQDVTHIIIDPSCSGSGLVASYGAGTKVELGEDENDIVTSNGVDEETVLELARAQTELILHAMQLPSAKTIAYSTCSVHRTENEDVVLNVLNSNPDWECVPAVPKWPHRGLDIEEFKSFASNVCRADYEKDSTNGFFVARFEKKEKDEVAKNDKVVPKDVEKDAVEDATSAVDISIKKLTRAVKKMVKEAGELKVKKVRKRLAAEFKIDAKVAKKRLKEVVQASSKLEIDGKKVKLRKED
jgi:putative methyltransferase